MSKVLRLISAAFGFFCLTSLSVQAAVDAELSRSSVVTVAQPEFSMIQVESFSWAKDHADVSNKFKQSYSSVVQIIDNAITQALAKKSYAIKPAKHNNLLIRYHVLFASEMDDTAFLLKYGLSPGLRSHANTANHERGTLVVELIAPDLNKVVWRGAVEVFTGLEKDQQGWQNRVNKLLIELFARIPAQK